MANAKKVTFDDLLKEEDSKKVIAGDTVNGTVISVKKHEILIDLGNQGVGLVPRREASYVRNLNVGDVAMNMTVFTNNGDNAKDVSTIMYLKDSSSNQNIVSDMISDLEKDGKILEENDKFFVIETQNANSWDFLNIGDDVDTLWSFVDGIFSSDSNVDVSTEDADVQVSAADGIKIVDSENSTVTLSNNSFHVSDASGEDVIISADGIKVTENDGSGEASSDSNVSVDVDSIPDVGDEKYVLCIKDLDMAKSSSLLETI